MEPDKAQERRYRALLAPGTPIRAGLERILHGRTGALVVLGDAPAVEEVRTGGFRIGVEFTPTALRELAKMDGAIILSSDFERIEWAGVHLVPNGDIPTLETGTRHRTADRVAQQTGVPALTVSASMSTIALYLDGRRLAIESPEQIQRRANQALSALGRYRDRLLRLTRNLSSLEVRDQVSVADLVRITQVVETINRLDADLRGYVAALGIDGRFVELQRADLTHGVDHLPRLLEYDYRPDGAETPGHSKLRDLSTDQLADDALVARTLGLDADPSAPLHPRGYRQLSQIAHLPAAVAARLVEHFGSLPALLGAGHNELVAVDGVDEQRARAILDTFATASEQAVSDDLG